MSAAADVGGEAAAARILVLAGSAEARSLCRDLAKRGRLAGRVLEVTASLAGATVAPASLGAPTRVGGFGGAAGLAAFLRAEKIFALIDATHPFAARISANAARAAEATATPLARLERPPWRETEGDRWRRAPDLAAAVALPPKDARVFAALGRGGLPAFAARPDLNVVARVVDAPGAGAPSSVEIVGGRPSADPELEAAMLRAYGVQWLIARNAGGLAGYGKIAAARRLGLDVAMIERPALAANAAARVETVADAVAWLERTLAEG